MIKNSNFYESSIVLIFFLGILSTKVHPRFLSKEVQRENQTEFEETATSIMKTTRFSKQVPASSLEATTKTSAAASFCSSWRCCFPDLVVYATRNQTQNQIFAAPVKPLCATRFSCLPFIFRLSFAICR